MITVRQFFVIFIGVALCTIIKPPFSHGSCDTLDRSDYTKLLSFIAQEDLQDPLVAFGHAQMDFDRQRNQENLSYLNNNKALIQSIQTRIKGESIQWRLDNAFMQHLIVPENRDEYAQLFEKYCKASIDFLLDQIQMPTPYMTIATLKSPINALPDQASNGITAYLVHNLADEYTEEYLFFNQDKDSPKIRIKLRNRQFDGKIGSYSSHLKIGKNNQFEFVREPYTLWQNSAKNPLNVLIVPIEETLHILVRPATETAIQTDLALVKPTLLPEIQGIVDDWMAVEEAIVGGVVRQVMPKVLSRFRLREVIDLLPQALAEREQHEQYRLLDQGIQVVSDLGVDETLSLYQKKPLIFKEMITKKHISKNMKDAYLDLPSAQVN